MHISLHTHTALRTRAHLVDLHCALVDRHVRQLVVAQQRLLAPRHLLQLRPHRRHLGVQPREVHDVCVARCRRVGRAALQAGSRLLDDRCGREELVSRRARGVERAAHRSQLGCQRRLGLARAKRGLLKHALARLQRCDVLAQLDRLCLCAEKEGEPHTGHWAWDTRAGVRVFEARSHGSWRASF
eukprot:361311-Chlamydomonas_euryale.AAC.1